MHVLVDLRAIFLNLYLQFCRIDVSDCPILKLGLLGFLSLHIVVDLLVLSLVKRKISPFHYQFMFLLH